MLDFEIGMYNALKKSFPKVKITGCYFHFGKCNYAFLKGTLLLKLLNHTQLKICISDKCGLAPVYANEPQFAEFIRMVWALCCCKPCDVEERFKLLLNSAHYDERAAPYIKYFLVCLNLETLLNYSCMLIAVRIKSQNLSLIPLCIH